MAASRARAADRAGAAHWRADEHHAGRARLAGANYGAGPRTAGGGLGHRPQPADRHRWLARDGLLDVLLVRVDALRPATHVRPLARRSTLRSVPRYRFEICWGSAKLPTGLDCGGLFYGGHWGLLGQSAGGCECGTNHSCLPTGASLAHTALTTGTSRHSACGREWGTVQPGWCLTRSHSGAAGCYSNFRH